LSAPHSTRAAPSVITATGAAVFISCQEQGEPTPGALPSEKDYGDIYGNVQDGLGSPIYNAQVTWECMDHDPWINLGTTYSDEDGYYECPPCWFEGHWSHDFRGTAAKTGYVSDVQYIYGWPPYEPPVRVDFALYAEK
jgi:hypothetical protein